MLNNAAKYTPPGGQIRLSVEKRGMEAFISVSDTGVGIPADMLPQVFDKFMQVDRSLEAAKKGLGIGLTLVRQLVELHGGSVEARSAGPGAGSEFIVRIPLVEAPKAHAVTRRAVDKGATGHRRRILIVDDNLDAADSLSLLLRVMGHDTQTAHDGAAAYDMAMEFNPELVLLDIGMPKVNGYDAARLIRREAWGKEMYLVALTGWGQDEDRRRSEEAGFNHHLTKPVDPTVIEELLESIPRSERGESSSRRAAEGGENAFAAPRAVD